MRKLMWLLLAAALWITSPAPAQGPFGRPSGPGFGPHFPGDPGVGDPFGRRPSIPGLPGQFDPFGRPPNIPGMSGQPDPFGPPRPLPWENFDPRDPLGRRGRRGLPGQDFGPGRPGGTARYFDPQPSPFDPTNPLNRFGLPGRNLGPAMPRPGSPNVQTPPPLPPIKLPELDIRPLDIKPLPGTPAPAIVSTQLAPESHSDSFDPDWWPWVFGGATVVFLVSLLAGYASGRRPA